MASSRASRDGNAFWGNSPSGIEWSRATWAPPHDGLLVATATTSKSRSIRFSRLVPRPETSTPSLTGSSREEHPLGAGLLDDLADHGQVTGLVAIHHEDHPQAHVEGAQH